jgi:hypothetical protein
MWAEFGASSLARGVVCFLKTYDWKLKTPTGSDAALFRRTAAVVRNRRDIADDGDIESDGLHGADGGFTTRAWTFDANFDFLETVAHGLAAGILRGHLGGVGGAFARAFESTLAALDHPMMAPRRSVMLMIVLLKLA